MPRFRPPARGPIRKRTKKLKVIDLLNQSESPILSFEVTPPEKGKGVREIFDSIDDLMAFHPQFINVTYHQPHVEYEDRAGVIVRVPRRKKPGTVGICAAIKHRYNVEPVPHFICGGFSIYETEDALIDLQYLGIENILALRGDPPPGQRAFVPDPEGHNHAWSLVRQIAGMNRGEYTDQLEDAIPSNFCIGVAGYPEKHYEAPNFHKEMGHLKLKVDSGADFVITQMFFEVSLYRSYVEQARSAGVNCPIIPGIKPVTGLKQLASLPGSFHVSIPSDLVDSLEAARTPAQEFAVGTAFMEKLIRELLDLHIPGLHIYTMGKSKSTRALLEKMKGAFS